MRLFRRVSKLLTTDERVIVRREQTGLGDDIVIVDGKQIVRDAEHFIVSCSVQSVTGDDVMLEPAGNRFDDQLWFYAWDEAEKLAPNDYLWRPSEDDPGWYIVQMCETFGSYTRARGQRIDIGLLAPSSDLLKASQSLAPRI